MQIAKKQLLGFGGLALVVAMTAFATTLPADATSSVSGNVDVYVQVYGMNTETVISSPIDGAVYNDPEIEFSETHSHAYGVTYILQKLNDDGKVAESWDLGHAVTGEGVDGITKFTFNLNDYGGSGTYTIRSTAGTEYGSKVEDSVTFKYESATVDPEDVKTDGSVVTFEVCYAPGVASIVTQVKNSNGEVVSETITNTPNPTIGGCMDIEVNLDGEESGKYKIIVNSYDDKDGKGNLIGTTTMEIDYNAPDAPNVPDTGSLLSALNISRADYLITGLIAFVAISVAALIVIKKSHKRQ